MSKLVVTAIGASLAEGVSSKSGTPKPYQFATVSYLIPAESYVKNEHNIQRCGQQVKEISMLQNQALFSQLAGVPYPCKMELHLSPDPSRPDRNIVSDFELVD